MESKKKQTETIPCPLPEHTSALELQEQDGKLIGICRCELPNNPWAGKPVYERALAKGVTDNG